MSSNSSLSTMQRLVEQLKLEAGVERIRVSQAAAELQQYCMQNACKDALLVGVPAGSNPFREPRENDQKALFKYEKNPSSVLFSKNAFSKP
ncbi:Guanine nucleotide-binding protein G(I)/G(S)/G(O) subunit gamma-10 [Varanus komodoensis]|nr:Guanine nucleotide-binding protein G(I)/G(S)/G(O) subunit gamma-10 [Varanus komodoensis]